MAQHDQASPLNIETLLVHGGRRRYTSSGSGTPTVPPIHASTTYLHDTTEALDQAFSGATPGGEPAFVYARQGNPNACALEEALARIEGGVGAVAFGSGMGAIHAALLAAGLAPGTKIVASQDLYGPTISLLRKVFMPAGVTVVLSDLCRPDVADFIRAEEPDVIYAETFSNPLVKVVDLDAISEAAREVGAVTLVDSTFTTPYLVRPIEHGFDIVIHSATKYISGHGDSTGGVAISAKNALLDSLRSYGIMLGAMLSPFEAHLMLRGLRTLSLRMSRCAWSGTVATRCKWRASCNSIRRSRASTIRACPITRSTRLPAGCSTTSAMAGCWPLRSGSKRARRLIASWITCNSACLLLRSATSFLW